jgi:hypothetical protein
MESRTNIELELETKLSRDNAKTTRSYRKTAGILPFLG